MSRPRLLALILALLPASAGAQWYGAITGTGKLSSLTVSGDSSFTGNVTGSTASFSGTLDVTGAAQVGNITASSATISGPANFTGAVSAASITTSSGAGIGTASPQRTLEIHAIAGQSPVIPLRLTPASGNNVGIEYNDSSDSWTIVTRGYSGSSLDFYPGFVRSGLSTPVLSLSQSGGAKFFGSITDSAGDTLADSAWQSAVETSGTSFTVPATSSMVYVSVCGGGGGGGGSTNGGGSGGGGGAGACLIHWPIYIGHNATITYAIGGGGGGGGNAANGASGTATTLSYNDLQGTPYTFSLGGGGGGLTNGAGGASGSYATVTAAASSTGVGNAPNTSALGTDSIVVSGGGGGGGGGSSFNGGYCFVFPGGAAGSSTGGGGGGASYYGPGGKGGTGSQNGFNGASWGSGGGGAGGTTGNSGGSGGSGVVIFSWIGPP